ncbi:MAG: sugar phosphate isomerase/epimerase [Gemmatales bacterium]|nr:sugar phosphate isomerase/epimerase [Gemmatales bacterium]MDW8387074.1 sugar phosphate isomerase/epimerase [Gemmatales bacterium]
MGRRPVTLDTGPWADLPLASVAAKAAEWGYQGLDLSCHPDHCDPVRLIAEPDYLRQVQDALSEHDLRMWTLDSGWIGQMVCGPICNELLESVPAALRETTSEEERSIRAAELLKTTAGAAERLGVGTVIGLTGSPIWPDLIGPIPPASARVEEAYRRFAERWNPILDNFDEAGVRFALHVSPGQIAFDYYSADLALDAIQGREGFGFALDPAHLHWQGVDPVEFLRRFRDRIYHVFIRDAAVSLDGRSGILGSGLPIGDPRRGWQFRCPGRGGVDWEAFIRGLNEIGYDGPLSVLWSDPGMDREHGAAEACQFLRRLDFDPPSMMSSD